VALVCGFQLVLLVLVLVLELEEEEKLCPMPDLDIANMRCKL
jgi:hypothetical protein